MRDPIPSPRPRWIFMRRRCVQTKEAKVTAWWSGCWDLAGKLKTSSTLNFRVSFLILQVNNCKTFIGGRCRIRTCDFHRVKVALYR
jgi:hypothetical protein